MPNEDGGAQQNTSPKSSSKKLLIPFVILLFVAIAFASWFVLKPNGSEPVNVTIPKSDSSEVSDVKSDSDLKKLEDEVKNTNIDGLSKGLKGNDEDASEF